jgi:hypothetical protein
MPTKYPKLSLALKKILDETHLNPADRWLILKQDPHELARILKAKLSENQWIRYYNAPSKDLPRLLNQDAENLESKAKLTSILDAKRQYRRPRNLESVAEQLQALQNYDNLTNVLNGAEEDQKKPGKAIDSFGLLIMRAARNGLRDHPFIAKFIHAQRLTINYPLLRKSKIKLEARLPRLIEYRQLVIEDLQKTEQSLEQISRTLV